MKLSKSSANNVKSALAYCKSWHFVDASTAPLGRLATHIATILQGKHKPIYHPVADCGDYVVVKNASKLVMTGKKLEDKEYIHHTGYPGGLRVTPITKLLQTDPAQIVLRAVKGMLPKNKLRRVRLERLKVFSTNDPTPYDGNAHIDYRQLETIEKKTSAAAADIKTRTL